MCVCVCVCVRERESEGESEGEREGERESDVLVCLLAGWLGLCRSFFFHLLSPLMCRESLSKMSKETLCVYIR